MYIYIFFKKGITEWIVQWKKNGWKSAQKKEIKNRDLWEELDFLNQNHSVTWKWVRGHAGHPENERADFLARQAIKDGES